MGGGTLVLIVALGTSLVWAGLVARRAALSERTVLLVAVALRLPFFFVPYASDDLHRYVWEGRIQAAGFNPFALAPDDPALAHLRDESHGKIGHPEYPTIYPPLAQALFLATTALGGRERALRNLILVLDVAVVAAILAWLRRAGRPPRDAILYAWCPLAIAAAGTGHVDPLMLLALAGAGWALSAARPRTAALLLGAAILAKTVAVLLVPWFAWRHRRAAAIVAAVVILGYAPYLPAGGIFDTLGHFATRFAFNGSLFRLAELAAPDHARTIAGVALVAWVAAVTGRAPTYAVAATAAFAGLLALSPTVHLWYLTWFLVALPAIGARAAIAPLVAWAVSTSFAVETYRAAASGGAFEEHFGMTALEYAIPAGVALAIALRARYRRRLDSDAVTS